MRSMRSMAQETRTGGSAFAAPPPDPALKILEPLLGSSRAEGHTLDSVLGPGVPSVSTESYYRLDGGYFLVSTYETVFGDEPAQKGVMYWGYDCEAGRFRNIFCSNNGPLTEGDNRYTSEVADGALTFVGPARFRYELDDDRRIRAHPEGAIVVERWLRDERGDWTPWMHNAFRRVGEPAPLRLP